MFLRVVRKPSTQKNSFASKEPDLEIEDFDDSFASLQEAKLDMFPLSLSRNPMGKQQLEVGSWYELFIYSVFIRPWLVMDFFINWIEWSIWYMPGHSILVTFHFYLLGGHLDVSHKFDGCIYTLLQNKKVATPKSKSSINNLVVGNYTPKSSINNPGHPNTSLGFCVLGMFS